jgi:hypothetical protein
MNIQINRKKRIYQGLLQFSVASESICSYCKYFFITRFGKEMCLIMHDVFKQFGNNNYCDEKETK